MPKHTQRKRFDSLQLAAEAAHGFDLIDPSIPGATITAEVKEIDGAFWLYVTSEGELVTDETLILPGYELVLP